MAVTGYHRKQRVEAKQLENIKEETESFFHIKYDVKSVIVVGVWDEQFLGYTVT